MLEELGLRLNSGELGFLRLSPSIYWFGIAYIRLSNRVIVVGLVVPIAWLLLIIVLLIPRVMTVELGLLVVLHLRIVHQGHRLLAMARLHLRFLLGLHHELQHLKLVFLH